MTDNINIKNKLPVLLETIKVENGECRNLDYHNIRFNETRRILFGEHDRVDLARHISIPGDCKNGIYKCRVSYGPEIKKIEFERYIIRPIASLQLVVDDTIDYRYKYADRSAINNLLAKRADCDDILVVRKGLLTDSSYANIAFWNDRQWITPSTPLLKGTCRARLLSENQLYEEDIRPGQLKNFSKIRIFNAMMDLEILMDRLIIRD